MSSPFSAEDIDLDPAEVARRAARGEVELVDVREPDEHAAGHVEGDRHIELERLASKAPTLPRDRPLVFYCRLGSRSAMAASAFRRAGYDAYSMTGGLIRWAEEGRPLEPADGHVAEH